MKKMILFVLALTLAGCSAFQSAPPTPQPTSIPPTAQVIIATVLVTVIPTQAPTNTPLPTDTPVPTLPPVTLQAPTDAPTLAAAATSTTSAAGPIMLDDNLGMGFFKNMNYSTDAFSLRCLTKSVTFNVTAANTYIVSVELYYRIQDKNSADISDWKNAGLMTPDKKGNFSLMISAEAINPDWRRSQTWFDFQFVGYNKTGERVGNSERFIKLINYSNDCP